MGGVLCVLCVRSDLLDIFCCDRVSHQTLNYVVILHNEVHTVCVVKLSDIHIPPRALLARHNQTLCLRRCRRQALGTCKYKQQSGWWQAASVTLELLGAVSYLGLG